MRPNLVTFDAAETLVRVRWQPGPFAVRCAQDVGLRLDEPTAQAEYDRMLRSRWQEYCQINLTKDPDQGDAFWSSLTSDWLEGQGIDRLHTDPLIERARERLYGPEPLEFELFEDTIPALESLRDQGYRLAVISNWDYSLHRILRNLGVYDYFEKVFASLEEGPEKPDPRLFRIVLGALGAAPEEAFHVGDNPVDDFQGARGVGMRAAIVDRRHREVKRPIIPSLLHLPEAFAWTD
jgi:REG-2-like HAD superfamily hydrolase